MLLSAHGGAREQETYQMQGDCVPVGTPERGVPLKPPVVKHMVSDPPKPPQKATRSTPQTIRSWRILIQNAFCDLRGQAPYSLPPDTSGGTNQTGYVFRYAERNFLPLRSIFGGWTLNRAQPPKTDLRDFLTFHSGA